MITDRNSMAVALGWLSSTKSATAAKSDAGAETVLDDQKNLGLRFAPTFSA
jgi:hypothetical protein